jgi:hypothetical protein
MREHCRIAPAESSARAEDRSAAPLRGDSHAAAISTV